MVWYKRPEVWYNTPHPRYPPCYVLPCHARQFWYWLSVHRSFLRTSASESSRWLQHPRLILSTPAYDNSVVARWWNTLGISKESRFLRWIMILHRNPLPLTVPLCYVSVGFPWDYIQRMMYTLRWRQVESCCLSVGMTDSNFHIY